MSWPVLTWKELESLIAALRPAAEGLFVDRVVVPERSRYPEGFLKNEWALRLTGRKAEATLVFSVRPRHPAIELLAGKGPLAAKAGTRSAFDLALSKHLRGARLVSLAPFPKERTVLLRFSADEPLALVLVLIPGAPEALLVRVPPGEALPRPGEELPVIARSRAQAGTTFVVPDGSRAPENPKVHEDWIRSQEAWSSVLQEAREAEAFELRLIAASRELRDSLKQARERGRQSQTAAAEAEKEADWSRFGDLLKSSLGQKPGISGDGTYRLTDYATGEPVEVPRDPKLSPAEQVEKFYQLARRKQRRLQEARSRARDFAEVAARFEKTLESPPAPLDWKSLERMEREAGIAPVGAQAPAEKGKPRPGKGWLGKTFVSKDGWTLWAGRSRDENLELTFKHARGNDLWMHVRGRPGSHVVVPVQPGKSVPLETLLDAATLVIHYSGGDHWGTTEVDYTYKKYVKRIKDSTEASYTGNKTLLIKPDPERLKRLLSQAESK